MRAFAAVLVLLPVLAGCLGGTQTALERDGLAVAPASFSDLGSPWLVRTSSGCGHCSGTAGYALPAEHHAFLLLRDLRTVQLGFSVRPGSAGFHVFPNITLPPADLEAALAGLQRSGDGEVWVTQASLGRVTGPKSAELPQTLQSRWAASTSPDCRDCGGVDVWLNASGEVRHAALGDLVAGDPMLLFVGLVAELDRATGEKGTHTGGGPDAGQLAIEGRALPLAVLQGCEPQPGPNGTQTYRDRDAFEAAWLARCRPDSPVPDVDFANHTAVGAWWGAQPTGGYRLGLVSATQAGEAARVVVVHLAPGDRCPVALGPSYPGNFAVLDGVWPSARFEVLDRAERPCQ